MPTGVLSLALLFSCYFMEIFILCSLGSSAGWCCRVLVHTAHLGMHSLQFTLCWHPFACWRMDPDGDFNFIMIYLHAFLLLLEGMLSLLNGIYIFHAHSAQQLLLSSQLPWAFDHFLLLFYPSLKCHLYPYHQQFVVPVTAQMAVCRNSISLKECAVCTSESTVFWILLMYLL